MEALRITLAQINPIVGDLPYNLGLIRRIRDEAPGNTDLVVFPEMAVCGYPPEDLVLKPAFMDMVEAGVDQLVRESTEHSPFLLIPTPWRKDGKLYNATLLIGEGRIQDMVFKIHLPNYGVFDERRLFETGTECSPMTVKGIKLGVMICEDMWFDDVATVLKGKGAEILVVVNASPFETDKGGKRLELAEERVAENHIPLIYVNQCGGQDELVFDGASFALGESGQKVMQAGAFSEETHHMVWERGPTGHWMCRADFSPYKPHDKNEIVYRAMVTGLRDYVAKNGFSGVIIGLSGGIDSALSAAIAVDALGKDAVHCVMMPSKFTSDESLADAKTCAGTLGAHYEEVSIEAAVSAFETELKNHFHKGTPSTTFENIQPRCRGLILMALSNASGKMVLSTGNKSEMAVGYTTLYGDMCGGFNVLKDIYKTQVYELAKWRNNHKPAHCFGPEGNIISERILGKPPSAELKDNQTDQDTLPPYEKLDDILTCLIEHDMSLEDIKAKGHDEETIERIWRMLDIAEYKRRQAPPGVKITSRAFGRDRRYPITNHFTRLLDEDFDKTGEAA